MGRKGQVTEDPVDPTAWMIDNDVANFVLLHQKEVLYMCMVSSTAPMSSMNCWHLNVPIIHLITITQI